jgi:outer membrane protein OmpA-like peptidoglycan-associated protein
MQNVINPWRYMDMRDSRKILMLIVIVFMFSSICFSLTPAFTVKLGRTLPVCDVKSGARSLTMFGGGFELWYNDYAALGIHPYFSQLNGGPYDDGLNGAEDSPALKSKNFRTYIAGADLAAKYRPPFRWSNIYFKEGSYVQRIAPYVKAGMGVITFKPKTRNGEVLATDERISGAAPVLGAGFTFFSKVGVQADLGFEHHFVNTDNLDGHFVAGSEKDRFWTFFVGLTLTPPPARKVVEAPLPAPVPEPVIEPIPEPIPEPEPEPIPEPEPVIIPEPEPIPEPVPEPTPVVEEPKIEFKKDFNLVIKGVVFKTGSAQLTAGAIVELDNVVASLKYYPEVSLEIQGHTDSDGAAEANMNLSMRRSQSVKTYLVSKGISADRLTTTWFGETVPIAPNTTPAGKQTNRRIEFIRTK